MNHFSVHLVQNDVLTYRQQFVFGQKQESKTFALLIRSVGFLGNAYSQKSKENSLDLAFLVLILKKPQLKNKQTATTCKFRCLGSKKREM